MKYLEDALNGIKILKILMFDESRKVGFGLWLFIVASYLLLKGSLITSEQWMTCMVMCSVLIGGGTVADSFLKIKKDGGPSADQPKP
jgi:hypothetical protein